MYVVPYTIEQVEAAHITVLQESGGESRILHPNILDSCSERLSEVIFGMERYPGLFMNATSLMDCISCFHVFVDANTRTALLSAIQFLDSNGWELRSDARILQSVFFMERTKTPEPIIVNIIKRVKTTK